MDFTRPETLARVRQCSWEMGSATGRIGPEGSFAPSRGACSVDGSVSSGNRRLEDQRGLLEPGRHVEGNDRGIDVRKLTHDVDDPVRRLVVQDPPPRLAVRAPRQEQADLGLPIGELSGQLQCGPPEASIRAVDHVEWEPCQAELPPAGDEKVRPLLVDVEVHRTQVVRCEGPGVLNGPGGGQVDPVYQARHERVGAGP